MPLCLEVTIGYNFPVLGALNSTKLRQRGQLSISLTLVRHWSNPEYFRN